MTQRDCILTVYKGLRKFSAKRLTQQGRRSRLILFSAFAFSLISRISPAQTIESEVEGSITDPSGGLISAAEVALINLESGVSRTLRTDATGHYSFSPVAPGRYRLEIRSAAFQTEKIEGLLVSLGAHLTQNVTLHVGSSQQTITVNAADMMIDTTSHDVSGIVDQYQINTLPVNTRQYLNLALLEPGTSQDASRTFYNNVQLGGGGYYHANGFLVDGVRNTWAEEGEPRQNFPEGAVQEFKVYVAQYPTEYGLYMGGLVSIVTKSGTNELHGEVFEYWRNEALNRDNRFQQATETKEHSSNPFNRNQFGADLGGPLVRNRTHFYLSYERTQTKASYTIFTPVIQDYAALQGTFGQPSYDQMITARVDHQLTDNHSLFVRYGQEWKIELPIMRREF